MDPVQEIFEDLQSPDASIRFSVLSRIQGLDWTPQQLLAFRALAKAEKDPGTKFHMRMILARLAKETEEQAAVPSPLAQIEAILKSQDRDDLTLALLLENIPRSEAPLLAMTLRENHWTEFSSEVLPFLLQFFKRHGSYEDSKDIVPFCRHHDPRILASAVEALEKLGPESLQGLIVPLLVSPIHGIRTRAVRLLYKWDPQEALRHFEALLFSDDLADRKAALFQAFFFPFPDIEALMLRFLSVEDDSSMISKAGLLFRANPSPETPMKILEIMEGTASEKRKMISEILMGILHSLSQAGLVEQNPEQLVLELKQTYRKRKLSQLTEQCRIALGSQDSENRRSAITKLGELSRLGSPDALKILSDHVVVESNPELHTLLAGFFGNLKEPEKKEESEEPQPFESLSPERRIKMLSALDSTGFDQLKKQIPQLIKVVADDEKLHFIQAIGRLGTRDDTLLIQTFLNSTEPSLLVATIESLNNLNPDVLFPFLPKLVQHSSDEVRATALRVFAIFDKKQALALVEQMMFNLKPKQRRLAIFSAGQFDFPSVRWLLLKALEREKDAENLPLIGAVLKENLDEELLIELYRLLETPDESSRETFQTMVNEFAKILVKDQKTSHSTVKCLMEAIENKIADERKKKAAQPSYSLNNIKKMRQQQGQAAVQPKITEDSSFIKFTIVTVCIGIVLTIVIWFAFLAPDSNTPEDRPDDPEPKPTEISTENPNKTIEVRGKIAFADPGGKGILVISETPPKARYSIQFKHPKQFKKGDSFSGKIKILKSDGQTAFAELIMSY